MSDLTLQSLLYNSFHSPLGLEDPRPRFSWQSLSIRRGVQQSACRVLVASSAENLASDFGDYWDTSRLPSSQSIQLAYGGAELRSRQRYYWKVQAWDDQDVETGWSEPSWFEMGLLRPEDWQARWISHLAAAGDSTLHPAPFLRKTFKVFPRLVGTKVENLPRPRSGYRLVYKRP
jgi:alpha-L-rhamnosidase